MQKIPENTAVVLINYATDAWLPIALNSFFEHFEAPRGVLLVDNDPTPNRHLCLYEQKYPVQILRDTRVTLPTDSFCLDHRRNHGAALDYVTEWVREHDYEYMLHFEPDCFIYGTAWWDGLKAGIDDGYSMAAIYAKPYGPLQPVPSLWKLADIAHSFRAQRRGSDQAHPRYAELYDTTYVTSLPETQRLAIAGPTWYDMWVNPATCMWDTAQKNWFDLAAQGRCWHVPPRRLDGEMSDLNSATQFFHAWWGSRRGPDLNAWPQLRPYARIRV